MSDLLLDTQAVLWFWWDDARLSARAKSLICDPVNRKLVSMVTPWEAAIKVSRGKLDLGGAFAGFFQQQMARSYFEWLPIELSHIETAATLPFHHSDPFDRLLICQALVESLPIVSSDAQFETYGVARVW